MYLAQRWLLDTKKSTTGGYSDSPDVIIGMVMGFFRRLRSNINASSSGPYMALTL